MTTEKCCMHGRNLGSTVARDEETSRSNGQLLLAEDHTHRTPRNTQVGWCQATGPSGVLEQFKRNSGRCHGNAFLITDVDRTCK